MIQIEQIYNLKPGDLFSEVGDVDADVYRFDAFVPFTNYVYATIMNYGNARAVWKDTNFRPDPGEQGAFDFNTWVFLRTAPTGEFGFVEVEPEPEFD